MQLDTAKSQIDVDNHMIPVARITVKVKLTGNVRGRGVQLLVSDQKINGMVEKGWFNFMIHSILDHEAVVIR